MPFGMLTTIYWHVVEEITGLTLRLSKLGNHNHSQLCHPSIVPFAEGNILPHEFVARS